MRSVQAQGERSDQAGSRSCRFRRARGERGVALIEFAIVMPLLFLLIFGIIEFGWAFFQQLDVRHGAREGARLAAVDFQSTGAPADQVGEIVAETCDRMDSGDNVSIQITQLGGNVVGQNFEITVTKPLDQLTGFLGPFLDSITLRSHVESRIEQDASWISTAGPIPCT